ncbi:MAG: type II CRISPR RNA-guided endonuclease Cas9 [Ruminococcus sp.]|nr:type II CRISPR RNA-guided endonuclease Cas9 [Ruminococcus sp.]
MANEKILLGLDIGSNSVGWAVTDEKYNLRKFKNNLMWGVHLFDEAQQSAERRSFRTTRRRLDRRQQRINLLQELFKKEILKVDKGFFLRLKESALLPEDSENRKNNIFFDDENYGDKEYFNEYPTIHHLIVELMNNDSSHDIRLVYYACAYILTHRGHFLLPVDKDSIDNITDFKPIYNVFYSSLTELTEAPAFDANADIMADVLKKRISSTEKDRELKERLFSGKVPKSDEDTIRYDQLTKVISGGTVKLSDLFLKEDYKELDKNSVCVKNADFSDVIDMLTGQIDKLHLALLINIKALYDWSLLVDIINEDTIKYEKEGYEKTISLCKVAKYDRHKIDLKELKYFARTYLSKSNYNEIFRIAGDKANYASYVYNRQNVIDRKVDSKFSHNDPSHDRKSQVAFCKFLKSYITKITPSDNDKDRFEELKKKCEDGELCPKQVTTDNRVIPYQLYYAELKKILKNACKYLPFLNEKDEYGTIAEKVLKIMEFRIPYYAGPLVSSEKSKNAWLVRKAEGKIYPWNFHNIIDEDASENEFIRRMTCKCTYLAGEDVLPKYSLLYSKFMVLNEINNIKVNGEPISVELKQRLYENKFVDSKAKVTKKRLKEYFTATGKYSEEVEVTGVDDTIKSSLRSYHDFKVLIESGVLKEYDVEKIIERITVTTDVKRLKKWLNDNYSNLSSDDIKFITKLKYNDYGRLSRVLLEEILPIDAKTGEIPEDKNIITKLWETNDNLMQLLSSTHGYTNAIEQYNNDYYDQHNDEKSISQRLKNMYIPTAVRRSITRTLDIITELKTILKKAPDKIFIEMSRGEGDTPKGSRTKSRRDQITEHLEKSNDDNIDELMTNLRKSDDDKLRSEKVFLYFMQLGKCAYTEKAINFEDLDDNSKWNIDHIWPQAKIKDDSLDNKVLVDSVVNGEKKDNMLKPEIREKMSGFWHVLYKKNMMSEKKYQRLMRNTPFTEEELSGFIARQLVETRQSTKAIATILKEIFPESEIVYVKAGIVSEFRQEMDMLKCREINDLHHAKDAYLNIVMGNVYNTKFTKDPLNFVKSGERYSMKLFKKNQDGEENGLLAGIVQRGDTIAWDPKSSFDIVRKMMSKNSIRYVRYTYKRKGGLFNQMPERKKEGLVPRKNGLDTEKYGGYNNKTASFFSIVKVDKEIVIIPIDLIDSHLFMIDESRAKEIAFAALQEFYPSKKLLSLTADKIVFPLKRKIIKINTMIEIDGYRVNICSKDSKGKYISVSSAVPLIFDNNQNLYIKKLESFKKKHDSDKNYKVNNYSGITESANIELYDHITEKCLNPPFNKWAKFEEAGKILKEGKSKFVVQDITTQVLSLLKLLTLLKTGRSANCDLSFSGGVANFNTVRFNSTLDLKKNNSVYIIDQSPTGLFEKKSVNLLKL